MDRKKIYVMYGNRPKAMVQELLQHIRPEEEIPDQAYIGIKPNLVVAKPSSSGATTSPQLVEGVIEYLRSKGYQRICILEGSWVGERTPRAFKVCGFEEISKKYGVLLIDLQRDSYREVKIGGIKIQVCNKMFEIDYLINIPVLKGHCQTGLTCALKNLKGCIPDSEKRRFHTMGLHKPIAYLNKILRQDLVLVDGLMGDLNFEEGGNPVEMNRILAASDPVLVDSYGASLLGYHPDEIPYIGIAEDLGVGTTKWSDSSIVELNKDQNPGIHGISRKVQYLVKYVEEKEACSACYGSLIHALERLREQGQLGRIRDKLFIGQYYRNKSFQEGIGIGTCARGFPKSIPGCPPNARDIVEFLLESE
ncbi:MAG: DUF362 domain-containing protein [Clostridia bacterium]